MKKLFTSLALLAMLPLAALAQANLPSNYFMTKLDNGLEVLVIEDHSVPIATIEINVKNGSYTESPEFSGLSHFYEHMFFKANKDLPSQEEYMKKLESLGMVWNGSTTVDRVNYFYTLPSRNLDEGLNFMNSAIRYPLFLEDEIKKEHAVVNGEFQRDESNPEFGLFQDLDKNMWGANFCRKNPLGDHTIILSATPEKMHAIQEKYYWPNNSLLTVAGDVDHAAVFEKVKNMYGDWKASDFDPQTKWPIPEFEPLKENVTYITSNENAQAPSIVMGWLGPDTRKDVKNTYVADVFSTIINLESSKFHKELVDGGLALETNISYQTAKYTGPIDLFVVSNPQKIKECVQKIEQQINMWDSDDYFTDEQIETAKNQLAIQDKYAQEQTSGFVHTVGFFWATGGIDYMLNYIDNVKKVTREDLKNYVRKYIKGIPKVSGLLISPEMQRQLGIKSYDDLLN
jgi:zinc protease